MLITLEQRYGRIEVGFRKVLGGKIIRTWNGLNVGYKEKGGVKDDFGFLTQVK